jgi:cytidine deaminase
MEITSYQTLALKDRSLLKEAADRLPHALNKVSNPRTSAIALTENGRYFGNNIFLSNCTLFCAEAMSIAAAIAANDNKVTKVYLVSGRADSEKPKLISPCGNCRQVLHDIAHLHGIDIDVICATNALDEVLITSSSALLPAGFRSASLGKMAEKP